MLYLRIVPNVTTMKVSFITCLISAGFLCGNLLAQGGGLGNGMQGGQAFPVTTAVPFMLINTDARSSGAGEVSAVTNSSNQPFHLLTNPSLVVGKGKGWGIKSSYTPWLRSLVNDIYALDEDFNFAFNDKNALSYTFRHFSLGNIQFTNVQGENTGEFNPKEFVFQLRYARMLSKSFALGIGTKYIQSNLATGQTVAGLEIMPGRAFAVDLGTDYRAEIRITESFRYKINAGLCILNFGTKISYTEEAEMDFIPINLNVGLTNAFKLLLADSTSYIQFSFGYQADKLMVPTPSNEDADSNGIYDYREKSVFKGAFGSFSDAPGGASEELREFVHHIYPYGLELVFQQKVLFGHSIGFFLENEDKGNRRYLTWSLTIGCFGFFFDFAKLHSLTENSPLDKKTYKISFGFSMPLREGPKLRFN